jgi:hypothetical protein
MQLESNAACPSNLAKVETLQVVKLASPTA